MKKFLIQINQTIIAIVCLVFLFSCNKDAGKITFNSSNKKTIKIENVKFAPSTATLVIINVNSNKDESACITSDSLAGTKCFISVGNSCKTLHDCQPVSQAAQSGTYTKAEIDQQIQLVEKAYGIKYTY